MPLSVCAIGAKLGVSGLGIYLENHAAAVALARGGRDNGEMAASLPRYSLRTMLGMMAVVSFCSSLPSLLGNAPEMGWEYVMFSLTMWGGLIGGIFAGRIGAILGAALGFIITFAIISCLIAAIVLSI